MENISGFNLIRTEDDSYTAFNSEYDEAMHTLSGAYNESLIKHVLASGILDTEKKEIHILDIGFGLGYNILALIADGADTRPDLHMNIISLEKSEAHYPLMDSILFNDKRDFFYAKIKTAYSKNIILNEPSFNLRILFGDARVLIKTIDNIKFDAVFHDPFSHRKNPELWSVEFFQEEYRLLDDLGILTTYSSAPQVRTGLIKAGFFLGKGPAYGNKKGSTIASKKRIMKPLNSDEIKYLNEHRHSVPYHDFHLMDSRKLILERWELDILSKECLRVHQE